MDNLIGRLESFLEKYTFMITSENSEFQARRILQRNIAPMTYSTSGILKMTVPDDERKLVAGVYKSVRANR